VVDDATLSRSNGKVSFENDCKTSRSGVL